MLKRLCLYFMTLVLMVFTIGVNVNMQFCGGEYIGVRINGIQFLTEAGEEMSCCTSDEEGCNSCHHIHHQYQLQSQYLGTDGVTIAPVQASPDWLHGGLPNLFCLISNSLAIVEEGDEGDATFCYKPPYRDLAVSLSRGLRAPPVWA